MKRYVCLKEIVLGFLTPQDQFDALLDPGTILEADEHTIWVLDISVEKPRIESITMACAIDIWLENGTIRELVECPHCKQSFDSYGREEATIGSISIPGYPSRPKLPHVTCPQCKKCIACAIEDQN